MQTGNIRVSQMWTNEGLLWDLLHVSCMLQKLWYSSPDCQTSLWQWWHSWHERACSSSGSVWSACHSKTWSCGSGTCKILSHFICFESECWTHQNVWNMHDVAAMLRHYILRTLPQDRSRIERNQSCLADNHCRMSNAKFTAHLHPLLWWVEISIQIEHLRIGSE